MKTIKKIWIAFQGIFSPWIMLIPLTIFKLLGFNVTLKHYYLVSAICLIWTIIFALWFLYFWKKTRQIDKTNS